MDVMLMGSGFYSGSYTNSKLITEVCTTCEVEVESDEIYYDDYQDHYILCTSCGDGIEITYDDSDYSDTRDDYEW